MMAMDTGLLGVEEHFIAVVHNTLLPKLQDLIPRASNLLLSASWTGMVILTMKVVGKRGRWKGETVLAVRGQTKACPSSITCESRMVTAATLSPEEASIVLPDSWLKQLLLTTRTMRAIHGILRPLNQHLFRHPSAAIVLWHRQQLCRRHPMHTKVGVCFYKLVIN